MGKVRAFLQSMLAVHLPGLAFYPVMAGLRPGHPAISSAFECLLTLFLFRSRKRNRRQSWTGTEAIAINQAALIRIVAALIAIVEGAGGAARLLRSTRLAVLRVLRPAESAVRRLIVIAARGIVVTSPATQPMPRGLAFGASASPRTTFQLFDPRRRFDIRPRNVAPEAQPRISILGAGPLVPLFQQSQPKR